MDIGHLPHPVLMHLQTFFDLWNSFILQAVQSGQPYISDHIMFEVRTLALSESLNIHHFATFAATARATSNTVTTDATTSAVTIAANNIVEQQ